MTRQGDVDARHESLVVEGDDVEHVLPPQELDPFTPEPAPQRGARRALWVALLAIAIVLVVVLIDVLR
jgi:hypothetical protein